MSRSFSISLHFIFDSLFGVLSYFGSLSYKCSPTRPSRLTRSHRAPRCMEDYHCSLNTCISSSPSPLTTSLPLAKFSSIHQKELISILTTHEPRTFHDVMKYPHWKDAMVKEIQVLELNNRWTLTQLPPGMKAVGCKWVYKTKFSPNGSG